MSNDPAKISDILRRKNVVYEARTAKEAKEIYTKENINLIIVVTGKGIFALNPKHIDLLDMFLNGNGGCESVC